MRLIIRTLVLAATLLFAGSLWAGERTVTLNVKNATCELCGPIVKKSLTRVPGVRQVEVSEFGTEATAKVIFDDGKATIAALIDATIKAGYPSRLAP